MQESYISSGIWETHENQSLKKLDCLRFVGKLLIKKTYFDWKERRGFVTTGERLSWKFNLKCFPSLCYKIRWLDSFEKLLRNCQEVRDKIRVPSTACVDYLKIRNFWSKPKNGSQTLFKLRPLRGSSSSFSCWKSAAFRSLFLSEIQLKGLFLSWTCSDLQRWTDEEETRRVVRWVQILVIWKWDQFIHLTEKRKHKYCHDSWCTQNERKVFIFFPQKLEKVRNQFSPKASSGTVGLVFFEIYFLLPFIVLGNEMKARKISNFMNLLLPHKQKNDFYWFLLNTSRYLEKHKSYRKREVTKNKENHWQTVRVRMFDFNRSESSVTSRAYV